MAAIIDSVYVKEKLSNGFIENLCEICDPRHNKLIEDGNKSDDDDAETLAQLLRNGAVKAVYKGDDEQQQLKELCRADGNLVSDATCAKNRLQAICRGRGVDPGRAIYRVDQRQEWLVKFKDEATRFRAKSLLDQLSDRSFKKKKRLQPWDNCKRLKFGGYLPHPGNRLTPFSGVNHLVSRCPTQTIAMTAPLIPAANQNAENQ